MKTEPIDAIEMLTVDDDGNAVPGTLYPRHLGAVKYLDEATDEQRPVRLAYRHKFFKYDDNGRALPETLVEFLVPEHLLVGGFPGREALRLVEQRMGWGR